MDGYSIGYIILSWGYVTWRNLRKGMAFSFYKKQTAAFTKKRIG